MGGEELNQGIQWRKKQIKGDLHWTSPLDQAQEECEYESYDGCFWAKYMPIGMNEANEMEEEEEEEE